MKRFLLLVSIFLLSVPVVDAQSIRKPWRELTEGERATYVQRVNELYQNGTWDQFVEDHAVNFGQHGYYFLIWHRHFLYYMEQEMGVPLVFWDWIYRDENGVSEWTQSSELWYDSGTGINGLLGYDLETGLESQLNRELGSDFYGYDTSSFWHHLDWHSNLGVPGFNEASFSGPHAFGHNWIGGAMAPIMTSPTDPVFYMHHSMLDQIVQWWVDLNWDGSDVYLPMDGPIGTVTGGPMIDPDEGFDRQDLKVWYANYNHVELYDYEVSNTEFYEYTTGAITARDFEVPAGTTCTFHADDDYRISLTKGFRATAGSNFHAYRSELGGGSTTRIGEDQPGSETVEEAGSQWTLYPNPAHDLLKVSFHLARESKIDVGVFDLNGKLMIRAESTALFPSGSNEIDLDIRSLQPGVYVFSYQSEGKRLRQPFIKH